MMPRRSTAICLHGTYPMLHEGMFYNTLAFNGDLSSWDVSNVTTMEGMFCCAPAFNGDLSSWNVSNVTKMAGMFYEAKAFNKDTIKNWNLEGKDVGRGLFEWSVV